MGADVFKKDKYGNNVVQQLPLLEELRGGQTEHIIELALVVLQQTKSDHAADQGLAFENTPGIVLVHREKNTGGLSELGEDELGSPHLTLATETVRADQLELIDQLLPLEGPTGILGRLGVVRVLL